MTVEAPRLASIGGRKEESDEMGAALTQVACLKSGEQAILSKPEVVKAHWHGAGGAGLGGCVGRLARRSPATVLAQALLG